MLDLFVGYFSNPLSWVFLAIFFIVGILAGVFLRPWMGNQVQKFIPEDHRFIDLEIDEETSISVYCKKKKGMPIQRFLKLSSGFTGIVGRFLRKPITRYLGMEGTAYTWKIDNGSWHNAGNLADAVKTVWGETFWASVPETQKEKLEESRILVTVGLDKAPLTPPGHRVISEEDIKSEEDRKAAETFWQERQRAQRGFYINMILAAAAGFGVCAVLVLLGLLKLPSPEVTVVREAANQTAAMLKTLWHSWRG